MRVNLTEARCTDSGNVQSARGSRHRLWARGQISRQSFSPPPPPPITPVNQSVTLELIHQFERSEKCSPSRKNPEIAATWEGYQHTQVSLTSAECILFKASSLHTQGWNFKSTVCEHMVYTHIDPQILPCLPNKCILGYKLCLKESSLPPFEHLQILLAVLQLLRRV